MVENNTQMAEQPLLNAVNGRPAVSTPVNDTVNNQHVPSENMANGKADVSHRKAKKKPKQRKKKEDAFENAILDIILAACLVILPMLALSFVFIGVVFHNRITVPADASTQTPFSHSLSLVNNSQSIDSAFFVDIGSARLATIASWTSTASSYLPSWVMLLFSYPLAKHFLQNRADKLPTPFQLRLLIELCTGDNYGSLWEWFTYQTAYFWSWITCRPNRTKRNRSNHLMTTTAVVVFICTLLGIGVLLADTWLHLTTTTVILQESRQSEKISSNLSRTLAPSCKGDAGYECTAIKPSYASEEGNIINVSNAYKTLFNLSTDTSVSSTMSDGQIYSFYMPAEAPGNLTYRASTFALSTQCSAITKACNLTEQVEYLSPIDTMEAQYRTLPFNCSSALSGDLTDATSLSNIPFYNTSTDTEFFLMYFNDSSLIQYYDPSDDLQMLGPDTANRTYFIATKPSYFAIGAQVAANNDLMSNSQIVEYTDSGTAAFLLECSAQVLNMEYTSTSSTSGSFTISDVTVTPAANDTILAITNPLLVFGSSPLDSLINGLRQAALSSTMSDLTTGFARAYSHTVLSMGVGATVHSPSLQESIVSTRQITRMPKAPFFTLIALNLLYVLLGLVLAIVAFASKPRAVKPVQARLSITGLVAALLEGERTDKPVTKLEELFEEDELGARDSKKVAIVPTAAGGWRFEKVGP